MNVYEAIEKDHETARDLLRAIKEDDFGEAEKRKAAFEELRIELVAHHQAEEAVFYARLEAFSETKPHSLEAANEHHVVNGLLEELATMALSSEEWMAKFGVMKEIIEHHMEEEEEDAIPAAKKVLGDDEATELGAVMQQKKAYGMEAVTAVGR